MFMGMYLLWSMLASTSKLMYMYLTNIESVWSQALPSFVSHQPCRRNTLNQYWLNVSCLLRRLSRYDVFERMKKKNSAIVDQLLWILRWSSVSCWSLTHIQHLCDFPAEGFSLLLASSPHQENVHQLAIEEDVSVMTFCSDRSLLAVVRLRNISCFHSLETVMRQTFQVGKTLKFHSLVWCMANQLF